MTADEIRKCYQQTGGADCKQELLAEIAAQLAELNGNIRSSFEPRLIMNSERRAKIVETLETHTTSYRNRYLKDSDPASWHWECSCGASLLNLTSWEACAAATKNHWAEFIDEALITQTSAALQVHWLFSIECDHEKKTDVANCACGFWKSQPMPTVGDAVKEWVKHVQARLHD